MLDPLTTQRTAASLAVPLIARRSVSRDGAIAPMFAVLLPVLMVFSGFAINLAYMQLVATELKVATDCASHAGGRAMSIHQTTDAAITQAELTIQSNLVAGRQLTVGVDGTDDQVNILFGRSIRGNNGNGMYQFSPVTKASVDSGAERATSIGVVGNLDLPMMFNAMRLSNFAPTRRSIATQVDRDIALVLDRSGSMLYFRDDDALTDRLEELYNSFETIVVPGAPKYHYWRKRWVSWSSFYWQDQGYHYPSNANRRWEIRDYNDTQTGPPSSTTERRISWSEYQDAIDDGLYPRRYTNNVIYQLERWENSSHTLGTSYSSSERNELTSEMAAYASDWEYRNGAPQFSRWYFLDKGVTAFLDVLDVTDQEERVSLVTFAASATLDYELQLTYDSIRNSVEGINPYGGTAIGDGMVTGLNPIVNGPNARPFAAKTIVVLTDGENNNGVDPDDAVASINSQYAVTIHTVTFTPGADQSAMQEVATEGQGRHYHADNGDQLVPIFEEIANNLPTILTE